MWTYKTIWNICISDFTVASLFNKKDHGHVCHGSNYSSNKLKNMSKQRCLIVNMADEAASPPFCPVHITERYSANRSEAPDLFPSLDRVWSPSPSPPSALSRLVPVSRGDLWPLQGYTPVREESFTRWMFKVAELWFVKCVFVHRHAVSSQRYKRGKILR